MQYQIFSRSLLEKVSLRKLDDRKHGEKERISYDREDHISIESIHMWTTQWRVREANEYIKQYSDNNKSDEYNKSDKKPFPRSKK